MTCTQTQLICELRKIADAVQPGWDWNTFWVTLLATIAGVVISGLVAWFIYLGQKREQYNTRIDDALVRVLYSAQEEFRELEPLNIPEKWDTPASELPLNPHGVLTTLTATRLIARGDDQEVVKALQNLVGEYWASQIPARMVLVNGLIGIIARWRSGDSSAAEVLKESEEFAAGMRKARGIKEEQANDEAASPAG